VQWERQRNDAGGIDGLRRPAGHPGTGTAATDEQCPGDRHVRHRREPCLIERCGTWAHLAAGDNERLLEPNDRDAVRRERRRKRHEVARAGSAAGAVPQHERREGVAGLMDQEARVSGRRRHVFASHVAILSVAVFTVLFMGGQHNPHDAVFRKVLGEPANAASQLRAVLPETLVRRLDLERLERAPDSFVDEELGRRQSDLVFTVPLDERDAFICVLIEHQSTPDPLMALRMLRYTVRIWDRYLAEHRTATQLPAVIPLVVFQNRSRWSAATEVAELIDLDPGTAAALGEHLPRYRFILDDLGLVDEATLRARPLTPEARVTLWLLHTAPGNAGIGHDLAGWHDQFRAIAGLDTLTALVTYIQAVSETPKDELYDVFTRIGPEAQEAYMTTADMLRAEGRAETLILQLTAKFGPLPQAALDRLRTATTEQLEAWTTRVLTADTIDEAMR
jgi:hypothetical protein